MPQDSEERMALLRQELPEDLEARMRSLERQSALTARGMEDMGRRGARALERILLQGADAERQMQRLAASLRDQVLRETLVRPLGGLVQQAAGRLLPGGSMVERAVSQVTSGGDAPAGSAAASNITINVSAPGGDPAQVRRSIGRASSELARVVARGQRQL